MDSLANIESVKGIAHPLYEAGVCALCILRSAVVPIGPAYLESPATIYRALGITQSNSQGPCPACLSILSTELFDQAVAMYKGEEFDCTTVCVNVEMPKSIYVRQKSLQIFNKRTPTEMKDTIKYIIGKRLAESCCVAIDSESEMHIDIAFKHPESAKDHQFLIDREGTTIKTRSFRKKGVDRTEGDSTSAIVADLVQCDESTVQQQFGVPPPAIQEAAEIESVVYRRKPLFVGGRYLKLERNISQTPFVVEGKRVTELSVSEVIGDPIKDLIRCDSYNMVGSGREDADVRMLGDGRPFYIECTNPRRTNITQEQISQIEKHLTETGSAVQCRRLQIIRPEDTKIIKEGEEHKTKHYCALVWFATLLDSETLDEINRLGSGAIELNQATPIRVLHRRAPLVRKRKLLRLDLVHLEGHFYRVRIESEAGTYIKEFVHGDLGRTVPSLSSLAGDITADIIELDVENVSLDFPPAITK